DHQREHQGHELTGEDDENEESRPALQIGPGRLAQHDRSLYPLSVALDLKRNRSIEFEIRVDDRPVEDAANGLPVGDRDDVVGVQAGARSRRIRRDAGEPHPVRRIFGNEAEVFRPPYVAVDEQREVREEGHRDGEDPPRGRSAHGAEPASCIALSVSVIASSSMPLTNSTMSDRIAWR